MIQENTLKEKWTDKNDSNDNYNLVIDDHNINYILNFWIFERTGALVE